jgi:hypothetical protein
MKSFRLSKNVQGNEGKRCPYCPLSGIGGVERLNRQPTFDEHIFWGKQYAANGSYRRHRIWVLDTKRLASRMNRIS